MELDAVPREDEHLAVERHRQPVPKQLRVLRHLSLPLFDRSIAERRRRGRLADQRRVRLRGDASREGAVRSVASRCVGWTRARWADLALCVCAVGSAVRACGGFGFS